MQQTKGEIKSTSAEALMTRSSNFYRKGFE